MEFPRYSCHKIVQAVKIADVVLHEDRSATITPEGPFTPFTAPPAFVRKHLVFGGVSLRESVVGGYYVVYEDGYASFSPAGAFEAGYTRI